jgi:hypothetical protein
MRIYLVNFLFLLCLSQLIEAQTQPVDIGYANLDITWDKAPLSSYKFRNGDKIEIVSSHKQWFKNCDSRKPSVWVYTDDSEDKVVYLYNYFAMIDKRNLAPHGYELPTKGLLSTLNGTPQTDFPFSTEPGKYLAVIRETKKTEIVNQPYYFWTSTAHESSLEGEEIAYIGSADKNSRLISSSTGEFCEGYPVLCFKSKPKSQYDYKLLLPGKYNDLDLELKRSINQVDWSALNGKSESTTFWLSLEGYMSFNNAGKNTSEGFDVAFDSDTKLSGIDFTPMNSILSEWPYYPESFGLPVPVSQLVRFDLMVEQRDSSLEGMLRFDQVRFQWLEEDYSRILREAMRRGRVDCIVTSTLVRIPSDTLGTQYKLKRIAFRGPEFCVFSPIGQATRLVTAHYDDSYKVPLLSGFLSLSVPAMLVATGYAAMQQRDLQRTINRSQPGSNSSEISALAAMKKDTAVLAAVTGVLISVDLSLGIYFGHKNSVLKKRYMKLVHGDYQNGIPFVGLK